MKKFLFLAVIFFSFTNQSFSQQIACENLSIFNKSVKPDLGIVISSGDPETVWNALRLAIVSESKGDKVAIFVINKAVDVFINGDTKFDVFKLSRELVSKNVDIYTCATCAKRRNTENVNMCTITSMEDLYVIVKNSKIVLTF